MNERIELIKSWIESGDLEVSLAIRSILMDQVKQSVNRVHEGYESALQLYVELKNDIDTLSGFQESIKDAAIKEAAHQDDKSFEMYGAKIQYREGSGRWDFKGIAEWNEKQSEIKAIEDRHKAAYQVWKRGGSYVDPETGEEVQPAGYIDGKPTISVSPIKYARP